MDIFILVGIALLLGFGGGKISNKFKVPQVVGFILIGVLIGVSGFNILSLEMVEELAIISSFALALIGFTIGGELEYQRLKKYGKSIIIISLLESLGAFTLVFVAILFFTKKLPLALIFGALASATAPAATVDVLWECGAKGPLTTTLFAVVGIDDAFALIIYGFAASIAKVLLTGSSQLSIFSMIKQPFLEIVGSILAGFLFGLILSYVSKKVRKKTELLGLTLGVIFLCSGLARVFHLSLIMTNMVLGITLINLTHLRSRQIFQAIADFTPPIYILFFVLVGARLQISLIPSMGFIGLIYIVTRVTGKSVGSYIGGTLSNAETVVKKYLGFGLLSQAGVAIGLAIEAWHTFSAYGDEGYKLGLLAINVITGTTFIFQIFGPPLTKYAIIKADEIGKDPRYIQGE